MRPSSSRICYIFLSFLTRTIIADLLRVLLSVILELDVLHGFIAPMSTMTKTSRRKTRVAHVLLFAAATGTAVAFPAPELPSSSISAPLRNTDNVLSRMIATARETQTAIPLIGVHDALSARIVMAAEHRSIGQKQDKNVGLFVSGFGVSASRLGQPDAGILTRSDMEDATRNILAAVQQQSGRGAPPVVMDGDTGYGGSANIRQTILRAAAMGVSAISIEDQVFPKRCTYVAGSGVRVVERTEAIQRIQAALAAQREAWEQSGNHISIIARTDCRMGTSFQEAIDRCLAFEELGSDIVYAENLQSTEEYMELRGEISTPMILAQVQTGMNESTLKSLQQVGDIGYELALWGVTGLQAAVAAMDNAVASILESDEQENYSCTKLASLEMIKGVVGFDDLDLFESRFPST